MKKILFFLVTIFTTGIGLQAQNLVTVSPGSAVQGTQLNVDISGQNTVFNQGTSTVVWFNQGSSTLFADNIVIGSNTQITAHFNVPYSVPAGWYNTNVWNASYGQLSLPLSFEIIAGTNPPDIVNVNPDTSPVNNTLPVTISGQNTHFAQGTGTITFQQGSNTLNVLSSNVVSPTQIDLLLNVPAGASSGYYDVIVDNPIDGQVMEPWGFLVTGGPCPPFSAGAISNICTNSPGTITMQGGMAPYQLIINGQTYQSAFNVFNFTPPDTGLYVIQQVTDVAGCPANLTDSTLVYHEMSAVFGFTDACVGDTSFANLSTISSSPLVNNYFYYGDGGISWSTTHIYNVPGNFVPVFYMSNTDGCSMTFTGPPVTIHPAPQLQVLSLTDASCGNNNGSFVVDGIVPGAYNYSVSGPSYSNTGNTHSSLAPGTYMVTMQDANSCESETPVIIQNISQLTNVQGQISASSGGPSANAQIRLLPLSDVTGKMNTQYWTMSDASGVFAFDSLATGSYLMYAWPDTAANPGELPVYLGDVPFWWQADTIEVTCSSQLNYTMQFLPGATLSGSSSMTGSVFSAVWGLIGTPIADQPVFLYDNNSNTTVAMRMSDSFGEYQFNQLAPGFYSILLDIPGFEMQEIYSRTVLTGGQSFIDLNYYVDSTIRNIDTLNPIILPLQNQIGTSLEINSYPNPFNESFTLELNLPETALVNISLFDVKGDIVSTLTERKVNAGKHILVGEGKDLKPGLYLIRAQVGNKNVTRRILKTE